MARPSVLADTLVETIGLQATLALVRAFGGKVITIPNGRGAAGPFSAWLVQELGAEAARRLSAVFGGERLPVPRLAAQAIEARNRALRADYDAGVRMIELVRRYERTERQIRTILGMPDSDTSIGSAVVDDRQMGLF